MIPNRRRNIATLLSAILLTLSSVIIVGCYQGRPSKDTPVHLNPNMDDQPIYKAQSESNFFANGSSMRLPVEGTIARGQLREDDAYYRGLNGRGDTIQTSPVPITAELLRRGRERYDIFCSPCHSRIGDGRGIVVAKGFQMAPTFHDKRIREAGDGYIFDVITNGIRNMPSYRHQIPVSDRWAIVAYFRALQRSQNATATDLSEQQLESMK